MACRAGEVTIDFDDNLLPEDGPQRRAAIARGTAQVELLQEVQKYLPDFRATFSAGELPSQFIEANLKKAAVSAAVSGKSRKRIGTIKLKTWTDDKLYSDQSQRNSERR